MTNPFLRVLAYVACVLILGLSVACCSSDNVSQPDRPTTIDEGVTVTQSESADTPATGAVGVMTFVQVTTRFEDLFAQSQLSGLLPYSEMPTAEVGWLLGADLPFVVTEIGGYEFANEDLALLFRAEVSTDGMDAGGADVNPLETLAVARYQASGKKVWTYLNGDFGYVIVSKDYWSELGHFAQQAREGAPIDPAR